jgi:hypothetical protein
MSTTPALCFSLVLASLTPAVANTYYVGTTGSDADSCQQATSPQTPRRTIRLGLSCLSPGDTLEVQSGVYDETMLTPPSGTPNAWVTVRRAPGAQVTIQGPTDRQAETIFEFVGASYIVIDGFRLDGRASSETNGAARGLNFLEGSHHITIKHTDVTQMAILGVVIHPTSTSDYAAFYQFINVDVHHNGYFYADPDPTLYHSGHGYYEGLSDTLICGGSIHDNAGHGIQYYNSPDRGQGAPSRNIMRGVKVYNNGRGPAGGPDIGVYFGRENQLLGNQVSGEITTTSGAVSVQTADAGDMGECSAGQTPTPPRPRLPAPTNVRIVRR